MRPRIIITTLGAFAALVALVWVANPSASDDLDTALAVVAGEVTTQGDGAEAGGPVDALAGAVDRARDEVTASTLGAVTGSGTTEAPGGPTTSVAPTTTPPSTTTTTSTVPVTPPSTVPAPSAPPIVTTPPMTAPPTTAAPAPPTTSTAPVSPPTLAATPGPVPAPGYADEFAARINGLRASAGLAALTRSIDLDTLAASWARHLAESGELTHSTIIDGLVGNGWRTAGENVGYGPDVSAIFGGLSASAAHHRNMVNPAFTHLGVGVYVDADGLVWTAHLFAG